MTTKAWLCDGCCKPAPGGYRYCNECARKIAERATPKDCTYCNGKETVHATYHFEGDYRAPYICHNCMVDTKGRTWGFIPENISQIYFDGSPIQLDEVDLFLE